LVPFLPKLLHLRAVGAGEAIFARGAGADNLAFGALQSALQGRIRLSGYAQKQAERAQIVDVY
jgi:hypothetical protein